MWHLPLFVTFVNVPPTSVPATPQPPQPSQPSQPMVARSVPTSFASGDRWTARLSSPPVLQSIPKPKSGIQLYRQRLAALQSGQIYTRLPQNSFESSWRNAVGQPTYEQWRKLIRNESRSITRSIVNPSGRPVAVMLGDSLMQWFPNDRLPGAVTWLNQGISGETTRGILARVGDSERAQLRTIYIMAGVNDIKSGISDREIIQNLSQTIQRLRDRNPNAQIVLQSILPTRSRQIQNDRIAHLNRSLLMMAEGLNVHYLDVHQYFAASDGYLRSDLTTDGIHLSEMGYAVWQSALEASESYLATLQRDEPIATR
jgi:lysophospholipase L1-like esterase